MAALSSAATHLIYVSSPSRHEGPEIAGPYASAKGGGAGTSSCRATAAGIERPALITLSPTTYGDETVPVFRKSGALPTTQFHYFLHIRHGAGRLFAVNTQSGADNEEP